jgi:hypothetical protein
MKMKSTTGRRTNTPRNHFTAARRWPLALLCGLLLLAGSAFAQDDPTRQAPAPEASETQKAPDPNEAVLPVAGSAPARTARGGAGGSSVDGDIVFTSPGAFLYPRSIRLSDSYGVLRFFASDSLTTSPTGAAVQLFGNNADTFNGQLYLDSGAHSSAGIFFRTAGTGGTLTERMRIRADGRIAINATTPLYSTLRVVSAGGSVGVMAENSVDTGSGVYGISHGPRGSGVSGYGDGDAGTGVAGTSALSGDGVRGTARGLYGIGVHGVATEGATMAGLFEGNVYVTGNLIKGSGTFKIDHPLDPANKYLSHSFVESPDMMNIYNGNVTTDDRGEVVVAMPAYFTALNRQFRYQLTVVGQFAQAIIASEIENNRFTIKTNKPRVKVSWQVTGVRQDAYAEAHRIQVEEEKPAGERGTYLHPDAFGQPAEKSVNRARQTNGARPTVDNAGEASRTAGQTPTNRQSDPGNWQ